MKKILLITDNFVLLNRFKDLVKLKENILSKYVEFHFAYSDNNSVFSEKYHNEDWIRPVNMKKDFEYLITGYDMLFSLHCKQLFPTELVNKVKCINIHPGLNPYNRGWYPQVFSIINGLPCGATVHEMDDQLDHGRIICQKEVKIEIWDTSLTAYNKILNAEIELLNDNILNIILGQYEAFIPEEGNINLKADFNKLCKIDLNEKDTFLNHINKLRALTHGDYSNAFFIDSNGEKVFLKLELAKNETNK